MTKVMKLTGAAGARAAIRRVSDDIKKCNDVSGRVIANLEDALNQGILDIEKCYEKAEKSAGKAEKALSAVAESYFGELPDDGGWKEVATLLYDLPQPIDLSDVQSSLIDIKKRDDTGIAQEWVSDLDDLELPDKVTSEDDD